MFRERSSWILLTLAWGLLSMPLSADQGADSGVVGRMIVAPELKAAKYWPIDDARAKTLREPASVRRATGRGVVSPTLEPNPSVTIGLLGANGENNPTTLSIGGSQFIPGQFVAVASKPIKVTNNDKAPRTIVVGEQKLRLGVGETKELTIEKEGSAQLKVEELPFATASVTLLKAAAFLDYDDQGKLEQTSIEPGDYQLVIFHGAQKLLQQEISIATNSFVAIDATFSANTVVTVSLKQGVQVLRKKRAAP